MELPIKRKHVIDILYTAALFFLITVTEFMVILLAEDIYSDTAAIASDNYESRTALSYITEKIRQNDENGSVSLGTFDGQESLILAQEYGNQTCYTYIYEMDDALYELFAKADANVSAADGTKIMEVSDLQMEQRADGLFCISCRNSAGDRISTAVSIQSASLPD